MKTMKLVQMADLLKRIMWNSVMPMRVKKLRDLVIIPKQRKDFTIEPNDLIVKVDQQKLFFAQYF
jgi:hypothetical protein